MALLLTILNYGHTEAYKFLIYSVNPETYRQLALVGYNPSRYTPSLLTLLFER